MAKDLSCPHCRKSLQPAKYEHDKDLNFICHWCGKIVFAVTESEESNVKNVVADMMACSTYWKKVPIPIKVDSEEVETEVEPTTTAAESKNPEDPYENLYGSGFA